ncbi:MAG: hypothetical protein K0R51_2008 [Cytophagaceae bacterium]|jgi:hypothetical protein|nr:hypothetical protein [Cytophagaceae bacterium]
MENNLDFSPSNDQNLRKAKTTLHLISGIFVLAFSLPLLYKLRVLHNHFDIVAAVSGIILFISLLLSPLALFYIVKSYSHKEEKKVQKLLYLIGILLFNVFFLYCLVRIVMDMQKSFF